MFVDSIEWSTLILETIEIDNDLYEQWTLKTWLGMDNGHRRCLVNGHWRICWTLMMPIRVYPLLFQIPTLDTYPEFLIEQCSRVSVPVSNCWCPNIELRYLVYGYSCYSAPRQWVIAIVVKYFCCTEATHWHFLILHKNFSFLVLAFRGIFKQIWGLISTWYCFGIALI